MLHFNKIPSEDVSLLKNEIKAMRGEDALQWKDRSGLTRKTFEFGVSFKEIEENKRIVKSEMPSFLVEIRKELVKLFEEYLSEKDPEKYENCIITIYSDGEGISPHIDRNYFGPDIIGLVIVPDRSIDPHKIPATLCFTEPVSAERIYLSEGEGTAFLFQGALRTHWKHQLFPVVTERIALQFRTLNIDALK